MGQEYVGARLRTVGDATPADPVITKVEYAGDTVVLETSTVTYTLAPDDLVSMEPLPEVDPSGVGVKDLARALHLAGNDPSMRPGLERVWEMDHASEGFALSAVLDRQTRAALDVMRPHTLAGLQEQVGQADIAQPDGRAATADELAEAVIDCLACAHHARIDLWAAIQARLGGEAAG